MALADDLESDINSVLAFNWDTRDGQVAPETDSISLAGGGVKLDATMLYADLADSTGLSMWDRRVAARVFKAFLSTSSRLIKARDGFVRSFDGDRVMGVFLGNTKNSNAVKCALQVNWMFQNLLRPKFQAKYEKIADGSYSLSYTAGVDTSEVLVVRAGVRNDNDLVWVGRAPNVAAKLSGIREGNYATFITGDVYDKLITDAKITNGRNMWEERVWQNQAVSRVFRSNWHWKP